jgi:hypothetical protein
MIRMSIWNKKPCSAHINKEIIREKGIANFYEGKIYSNFELVTARICHDLLKM